MNKDVKWMYNYNNLSFFVLKSLNFTKRLITCLLSNHNMTLFYWLYGVTAQHSLVCFYKCLYIYNLMIADSLNLYLCIWINDSALFHYIVVIHELYFFILTLDFIQTTLWSFFQEASIMPKKSSRPPAYRGRQ